MPKRPALREPALRYIGDGNAFVDLIPARDLHRSDLERWSSDQAVQRRHGVRSVPDLCLVLLDSGLFTEAAPATAADESPSADSRKE